MSDYSYNWNDRAYPYFYPVEDDYTGDGSYRVEFQLTCYPYAKGSSFANNAFPPPLLHFGINGNTNFYFIAQDENGNPFTGLSWNEAVEIADKLNERFENELDEAQESWDWDSVAYVIDTEYLIYNK